MKMTWSSWKNIDEPEKYNSHAVYEVRLVNEQGNPVTIYRFLDEDKGGIISIGRTTKLEERRKQFIYGEQRGQGHSEGNLLYLLKKYSFLKKI